MASDAWGSLTTASELGKREGWYSAPSRGRAGREEGTGGGAGKRGEETKGKEEKMGVWLCPRFGHPGGR